MRIMILQLARLGDVLQTLPTIQALKKQHGPNCHITLVIRSTFADAARLSPHVDKIVEFPTKDVLGHYFSSANPKEDKQAKLHSLAALIAWLCNGILRDESGELISPFDLLLNLTFSPASSYLSEIIPANEKRGLRRAIDDAPAIDDSWSRYLYSQVLRRNLNMLHLTDIFLRIGGAKTSAWPLEIKEPPSPLEIPQVAEGRIRVGVQIGASQPEKTLNPAAWAVVCESVLRENLSAELVFFGAKSDLPAIQETITEIQKISPEILTDRCTVIAGKMRFHENVHWIRACSFIVSPDTAMVHLASICDTPVICVPIGTVRPEETGPYGERHHVIYPAQAKIEELAAGIAQAVAGKPVKNPLAHSMTKMALCSDGSRRMELIPQNFILNETTNFFLRAYYLLAEFRCDGKLEDIEVPRLGDPRQAGELDRLLNAFDALCTTRRLAEFGQHYCLKLIESIGDLPKLNEWMAKLTEIEVLLAELQKTVSFVKPLIDTWGVAKENAISRDLETLAALTEGTFRELVQNVDIVHQLLQTAVQTAQDALNSRPELAPKLEAVNKQPSALGLGAELKE